MKTDHRKKDGKRTMAGFLIAPALTLLICCCTMRPAPSTRPDTTIYEQKPPGQMQANLETMPAMERQIRRAVQQWSGTPHKMGGSDRTGVDCSGFVQNIYRELFHINLPRTTRLQAQTGITVSQDKLNCGDLVFFHPPNKIRHVGIYLGNGDFAHASTSLGVTISSLHTTYWREAYWLSKRIRN